MQVNPNRQQRFPDTYSDAAFHFYGFYDMQDFYNSENRFQSFRRKSVQELGLWHLEDVNDGVSLVSSNLV